MAYQGLFTQGITVDDLLKQRRVRSQANQQQMMKDAAQGARDPQRARMGSMFGSILGRALGDNAGGPDTERAALEAKNAQLSSDERSFGAAAGGNASLMKAEALRLLETNPRASLAMTELYKAEKIKEDNRAAAIQTKAEDDLTVQANLESKRMEAEALQAAGKDLSIQLASFNPTLSKLLGNGKTTQKLIDMGHEQVVKMDAEGETGKKYNSQVSGADLNAIQGTTNYDPTAMFNYNSKTKSLTSIGRTGSNDQVSTRSQEITEAYGVEAGSDEHRKLYQQALDIGPSLSITDIKTVRGDWSTATAPERENMATADEIMGLVDLSSLGAIGQESVIADRLVSRLFGGSDQKAQAEMNAFRSSGSIGKRIADSATMFLQGVYTTDTFEGFKKLAAFSKSRNIQSYNNKLKTVKGQYSMAQNLSETQVSTLFGEALEQDKAPSSQINVGTEITIDGVVYVLKGGDSSDVNNWEPK